MAREVGKTWTCPCWEKGNLITFKKFIYGKTWKILPSTLYSIFTYTFSDIYTWDCLQKVHVNILFSQLPVTKHKALTKKYYTSNYNYQPYVMYYTLVYLRIFHHEQFLLFQFDLFLWFSCPGTIPLLWSCYTRIVLWHLNKGHILPFSRSCHWKYSVKRGILGGFRGFTTGQLCCSLFLITLWAWGVLVLLKVPCLLASLLTWNKPWLQENQVIIATKITANHLTP